MQILIRFKGDNDFGNVLLAFGNLLIKQNRYMEHYTKQNITNWFNDIAYTLFLMVQKRDSLSDNLGLKSYLKITESDVYLGDEVYKKMETVESWCNYDSVMIVFGPKPIVYLI